MFDSDRRGKWGNGDRFLHFGSLSFRRKERHLTEGVTACIENERPKLAYNGAGARYGTSLERANTSVRGLRSEAIYQPTKTYTQPTISASPATTTTPLAGSSLILRGFGEALSKSMICSLYTWNVTKQQRQQRQRRADKKNEEPIMRHTNHV